MNLNKNHYSRRALALLLTLVMCVGMIPTAFAAQQNSYHDPAEHWMQASGRTNELDANSVVTRETFKCGECGKATSFEVFRVPEYTRNGQPALSHNVKYSDGTMVDGVGKGDTMDGIPGKDAAYTGYHYTKAVCETCGGINTNMSKSEYGYLKNVYWLYDCAAEFTQKLDETVSYEYTDDTYHTVTTKGGTYCAFCYGTNHICCNHQPKQPIPWIWIVIHTSADDLLKLVPLWSSYDLNAKVFSVASSFKCRLIVRYHYWPAIVFTVCCTSKNLMDWCLSNRLVLIFALNIKQVCFAFPSRLCNNIHAAVILAYPTGRESKLL